MKKRGISLIVLIVTIIVVIILAAVVILTLSKNNPIESAKEARFKEDVRTFQDELALAVSKEYTSKAGARDEKIIALKFDKIKEYIPSFNQNYDGKFVIKDDMLAYKEEKLNEKELNMVKTLGVGKNIKTSAEIIDDIEDKSKYYGQYVLNYDTGHNETKEAVDKWQIFHSDGENIYLIADDYIKLDYIPKGRNNTALTSDGGIYRIVIGNVKNDYVGAIDILNDKNVNNLLRWAVKYPDSKNDNIKSVAYLLDTTVWKCFAGLKAKYAIGAPTIDLVIDSYNKTHNTNYSYESVNENGYFSMGGLINNGEFNGLYVIPDTTKANAIYIASPSSISNSRLTNIYANGCIDFYMWRDNGIRPIVCLNSNVKLKEVTGGFEIE